MKIFIIVILTLHGVMGFSQGLKNKMFSLGGYDLSKSLSGDRGEVGTFKNKFLWTCINQAFVPNFIMLDALTGNLIPREPGQFQEYDYRFINEENIDGFMDEFMHGNGFNGIHLPVFGQWFHIEDNVETEKDSIHDLRTFDKLAMIIEKVYRAGGSTYLWVCGEHQRRWTSKSTKDGIMGKQEQAVMDMIAEKLGLLKGWFMGYRFDLWEWVTEEMTRQSLWLHTMAVGIGAIWGNLDSTCVYSNKDELKCFSVFWNDNNRFRKDMEIKNDITNGYCLRDSDNLYVFYNEDTNIIVYRFSGKAKKVIAVDTKSRYQEIHLGTKKTRYHVFNAPYVSDWTIAVEN